MGAAEKTVDCRLKGLLEKMTGLPAPFGHSDGAVRGEGTLKKSGMGYSQPNEVLLALGYKRVSQWFFQYLVDGSADFTPEGSFGSLAALEAGIERFRQHAMLRFGNVQHAFEWLSTRPQAELAETLGVFQPIPENHFIGRHDPMHPIEPINGEDTYYLGYIVKSELEARLRTNPKDAPAKAELEKRERFVQQGIRNHLSYLASDHMDVYVATSMRERHEYYFVHEVLRKIFSEPRLSKLKLRWFDPTQAYCLDRIDKGLSEGLMLKRAKCTLYFAQETDTLGKDSELASTLAQGKTVIAFVPKPDKVGRDTYVDWILKHSAKLYPGKTTSDVIRLQLQLFAPELAWTDQAVRHWIDDPKKFTEAKMREILATNVQRRYDIRAKLLGTDHPLGIQVNLDTGVANGVLVARTTADCAEIIRRVVTNTLEFKIEEKDIDGKVYLLLRESVSGSVFRVVTGDRELTNAFWNFYLA